MSERFFGRVPVRAAGIRELGERDLRVLISICAHADADGQSFPSLNTIAAETGIGRCDIPRMCARLESSGLIRRHRRPGAGLSFTSTIYTVIFDAEVVALGLTPSSAGADRVVAPALTGGGSAPATGVVALEPIGSSVGATLTEDNRSINRLSSRKRSGARTLGSDSANEKFETFWRSYPSRGGHSNPQKTAREKFEAAVKRGIDPETMIRAAGNYAEAMRRSATDGQFIAQAKTWLTQARWEQYAEPEPDPPLAAGMI